MLYRWKIDFSPFSTQQVRYLASIFPWPRKLGRINGRSVTHFFPISQFCWASKAQYGTFIPFLHAQSPPFSSAHKKVLQSWKKYHIKIATTWPWSWSTIFRIRIRENPGRKHLRSWDFTLLSTLQKVGQYAKIDWNLRIAKSTHLPIYYYLYLISAYI